MGESFMNSRYSIEDLWLAIFVVGWLIQLAQKTENAEAELDLVRARMRFLLLLH
jgi:hypothetical protein